MQIKVRSLQGDEYTVSVQNDQLVSQLKASISEKANGLPIDRLKLVYKGRTMQDTNLVSEYNLHDDCKVHLILQKENSVKIMGSSTRSSLSSSSNCPMDVSNRSHNDDKTLAPLPKESSSSVAMQQQTTNNPNKPQSRFEIILRERLAQHFSSQAVEQIMANLQNEINADINSSSLDDLERLAKQKLNISNE